MFVTVLVLEEAPATGSGGDIASEVGNNSTLVGADIDASAYALVQSIYENLTGNPPGRVCTR